MLNNKTIAVVVPAYNEEKQIGMVIDSMPEFVDRIIDINYDDLVKSRKISFEPQYKFSPFFLKRKRRNEINQSENSGIACVDITVVA